MKVLGVDSNGWHGLAGLVLYVPGLLLLRWPQYTRAWVFWVVAVLLATGAWSLLDDHPVGLLFLPDGSSDFIFHVVSALAFVILLPLDKRRKVTA